ncbi:MAG: hypothetical protein E7019_03000 [Alphaproteobacteria bacterium]|nr:hypothetical protein [Alphaproteobacteria bacterium]
MASIKPIKYTRDYDISNVDLSFWDGQFVTEMLASEAEWKKFEDSYKTLKQAVINLGEQISQEFINNDGIANLDFSEYKRLISLLSAAKDDEQKTKLKEQIETEKQRLYEQNQKYQEERKKELKAELAKERDEERIKKLQDKIKDIKDVSAGEIAEIGNKSLKKAQITGEYDQKEETLQKLNGLFDNGVEDAKQIRNIYNSVKGDPEKLEKFKTLYSLMQEMNESSWAKEGTINDYHLDNSSGKITLRIKNLGDSGLNVAFDENMSFVFENGGLTKQQLETFADFFEEHEMSIDSFDSVKDLKIIEDGEEIGTFEDVYKKYIESRQAEEYKELTQNTHEVVGSNGPDDERSAPGTRGRIANDATGKINDGSTDTVDDDGKASFSAILANSDDKINDDMTFREMSKPIMARAGIARIDKKCCVRRRLPDGSYMIAWYGSETDKYKDCKIDPKTGIAQHTKKVAFILHKNPPRIGIYLPQGAKFEGSYAKATLGTIKAMGYKYFKMPSAVEFGGDACGAFWEAAGDQLVCPLLKRSANDDGCSIGNDDLTKLLKAMKEKNNLDESQEIEFKMRLVEELKHHTAYLRDTGNPNSSLETTMKGLEGDARFYHFSKSVLPNLDDKITEGVRNGKWNAVDIACAHKAQAEIIKAVEKGMITYTDSSGRTINQPYDYLHPDMSAINMMFECEMKKAEPEVIEWFKKNCKPGAVKDDDPTYGDDDDQINGFKQNDFNTYSQKLVMEYKDIATKAFKDMASKYPGSEKITDKTEPVQIKVVPTLDMNRGRGDVFANVKSNRNNSTSPAGGRGVSGATR